MKKDAQSKSLQDIIGMARKAMGGKKPVAIEIEISAEDDDDKKKRPSLKDLFSKGN